MSVLKKIVKSNELVRMPHFSDCLEQKLFARMVVEVRDRPGQEEYQIPVLSLVKDLDMTVNNREYVEEAVRRMFYPLTVRDDVWIKYLPVFKDGKLNIETGMVHFSPAEELLPHILNLAGSFTAYSLSTILGLKSGYSIKLYELFLSDSYKDQPVIYKVDDLREMIGLGKRKYVDYYTFKIKVIDTAKVALSDTDINFDYAELKTGKKITALAVTIKKIKEVEKAEELRENAPKVDELIPNRGAVEAMESVLGIGVKQAIRNWEYAISLEEGNEDRASERIYRNLQHTEDNDLSGKIKKDRPSFFHTSLTEDWAKTIAEQNQKRTNAEQLQKTAREAREAQERQKAIDMVSEATMRAKEKEKWLSEFDELPAATREYLKQRKIEAEIQKGAREDHSRKFCVLSYVDYKIAKETGTVLFDEAGNVFGEQQEIGLQ